ncbi:MAG: 2-succinyl-5-enolpyruvyl-6-hydroxy-3-cyclohexene-1-carboxylic-acid synthase [Candidatus Heimdallarchaeota archaeon]|nr:2-succinyl-5-enolpyruvyl-6-hydroxy-3-cyclohexene-1-carboxylic-acid synthase [Candidatus Heimdallarchaeota archaeon]
MVEILPEDYGSLNLVWSLIFADELHKAGIRDVCISPGSRSTPLVLAFYHHGGFNLHINVDERSSAFFALGIAKGTMTPSVLVCTSGTATANYFPAIIEADKSNIPLIVVTADRPSELRNSGTNQTIDQINLYGNKVRYFTDVPPQNLGNLGKIQTQIECDNIRNIVFEAYTVATSKSENGPVHINFPFSKPLEPKNQSDINKIIKIVKSSELTKLSEDRYLDLTNQIDTFSENDIIESLLLTIQQAKRIIVICGPLEGDEVLASKIVDLTNHLEVPLFMDVLSGIRFSTLKPSQSLQSFNYMISSGIIKSIEEPDLILHFGWNPISSAIEGYINNLNFTEKIQITPTLRWNKPIRPNDTRVQTDPIKLIEYLLLNISKPTSDVSWSSSMVKMNKHVMDVIENRLEDGFEANIISRVLSNLNLEFNLFLSNSLSIRYVDEFGFNSKNNIHIFGNRGASGIDGIVSTTSGIAYITKRPTLLIIGDLALFQDIQGLHNIKNLDINLTILVINNNGGGIFRRLPISKFEEPFELLFNTPIDLNIQTLAQFAKLPFNNLNKSQEINSEIKLGFEKCYKQIIEFQSDSNAFEKYRTDLIDHIRETFSNL